MEPKDQPAASLVEAFKEGSLLGAINERLRADRGERDALSAELASLHNSGQLDLVSVFSTLGEHDTGVNFFLLRRVFEKALPDLNSPVPPIMSCVLNLLKSAGQDLAAGDILGSFISFCEKNPVRPAEALTNIKSSKELIDLIVATLVAGSRIDHEKYVNEAIALASHPDHDFRRQAIFAFGRFKWPASTPLPEAALLVLEKAAEVESDDHLLGCVIKSAFQFQLCDASSEARMIGAIEKALEKGGDYSLHAASELAFFNAKELSKRAIATLWPHFIRISPKNKSTLDNIDYFLSHLIKQGDVERAISIVEEILLANQGNIQITAFDGFMSDIRQNEDLLAKVLTRWFLNGNSVLCSGVRSIVGDSHSNNLSLKVDADELGIKDLPRIMFVGRKAIGYLFLNPISAASVLISLMHLTEDDQIIEQLGQHLYDPLLLNFSGKAREYVSQVSESESGKVKQILAQVLAALDTYFENLRSVGYLPELRPSTAQQEAQHRHSANLMAESMREAEKQSVFLSIISKSVLLYGRRSISYVYGQNGQALRKETPLHSHSVEFDMPRSEYLDPFGLDYTLRVLRREELRS